MSGPTINTISHEHSGQRPVLILSQGIFNQRSETVIAMALTSQEHKGKLSVDPRTQKNKVTQAFLG